LRSDIAWLNTPPAQPDEAVRQAAIARQKQLTKPPGALGRLETLAIELAALQGKVCPSLERLNITVFAADHGVATEGVSAFPQAVTAAMVKNFAQGGAAISVLARALGAQLEVINLGTVSDPGPQMGVEEQRLGPGTANFCHAAAMSQKQLTQAINTGRQAAIRSQQRGGELFIGGEMGIGNTTAAAALGCSLLNLAPEQLTGPGTGLTAQGIHHKIKVIQRALDYHGPLQENPLEALRRLGGFEIAALTGSYLACAQIGLPVLVDGYISSVAALIAVRLNRGISQWLLYAHTSAEPGHRKILEALKAVPLLEMGMRLGEGSGAAYCVSLLRLACALHNEMATFSEAGVAEKIR
jgi:nicotinate-nucleotide--dimethylbenzimidazole phosphoribosyltransferase